tara:strand:+ start:427 stop:573 length:147 start_codon:yes stop_codon:yes gene_type:complete
MKKILITGATGFLGKKLAYFLKNIKKYKIILSENFLLVEALKDIEKQK